MAKTPDRRLTTKPRTTEDRGVSTSRRRSGAAPMTAAGLTPTTSSPAPSGTAEGVIHLTSPEQVERFNALRARVDAELVRRGMRPSA